MVDGGGAGARYVRMGAAVARDLLRLSGAVESGCLPRLRALVVPIVIEWWQL